MCLFAGDWVYLPDERERQEYVMNEQGIIYYGTSKYPRPMTWVFGQVSSAARLASDCMLSLFSENNAVI